MMFGGGDYIGDVGHGTRVAGIIAVGIEYAADMGAAILQNSWGEPSFLWMRWDENNGGKIMLRYYAGCPKEEYGSDMKGMTVEMEFLVVVRGNKDQEGWLIYFSHPSWFVKY